METTEDKTPILSPRETTLTDMLRQLQHVLAKSKDTQIQQSAAPEGNSITLHCDISDTVRQAQLLVEQNELLKDALGKMSHGLCMFDKEQRLIVSNDRYAQVYDLPPKLLKPGITLSQIIEYRIANGIYAGENPKEYIKERQKWVASGIYSNKIQELSDGRSISITHQPMNGGGWITTHEDITERTAAEKARRESQELFAKAFRASPAAMAISDPATSMLLDVNGAWTNMLGFSREEALSTNVYDLGFWIDIKERERIIEIVNTEGSAKAIETRLRTKDGCTIIVVSYGEQVEVGGLPRLLLVSHDITERKRSEEALRASERRFKDIVEISSDWVWECNEHLQFTFLSERFSQVTGLPKEQFLGKTRQEASHNSGPEWDAHLVDLRARRPFREFMNRTINEAGEPKYWMISGRPVFDSSGKFIGYRGTGADQTAKVRDKTELIRHRDNLQDFVDEATVELSERAEELRQALAKEKELNEIQRQFVSMASHEFRTPLAIIDSAAQRILRKVEILTPEDTVKRIEKIRGAVRRMTRLMESTLNAARMEEGKIDIEISDCDLRFVILEVEMNQIEISPNHDISCDLIELPTSIRGDKGAMGQIFSNLISNAVKYSPDSAEINVRGRIEGEFVVVEVKDHGLGIDEKDLPKMFQRFFRAKTSSGIAGTGIGLNLVKTLVELHDGSIHVRSVKDTGSVFTVRLPIKGPAQGAMVEGRAA